MLSDTDEKIFFKLSVLLIIPAAFDGWEKKGEVLPSYPCVAMRG